jgi:nitrogen-specific signal transduction histidine kinase
MRDIIVRMDALAELIHDLLLCARPRLQLVEVRPLGLDAVAAWRRDPVAEHVQTRIHGDVVADGDSAREGESCRIEVRDEGPGIPREIHDAVFDPFFATKARGGGPGLAIARRTAERHGGSIGFECAPTGGTVMTIHLPLSAAPSAPGEPSQT